MKKFSCLLLVGIAVSFTVVAQNIGIGTQTPDSSALLELSSNSKGFLPPRMTTAERNAIANPAVGLQIYNTTTDCLEIFGKGKWHAMYCIPADTTLITDIDGNSYPTVKICNQTWMAKNLDVARYRNGDIIPQVTDPAQWANLTTGAWCWYNNDSATYGAVYGRLYNWYAVNDPRGLAPQGWHVPSDGEWANLSNCLGGNNIAGALLKETGTAHWENPNEGATNASGFSGIPAGYREQSGSFQDIRKVGVWWSSTIIDSFNSNYHNVVFYNSNLYHFQAKMQYGFSVRCVQDVPPSTIDSGLVAYYPFNSNANDESGNGNNGTVNGATLTTDRFGNAGKAYSFDGSSYINGSADNFPSSNSFRSISIWFNASSYNNLGILGTQLFGYGGGNCGTSFIGYFTNQNTFDIQGHCGSSAISSSIQNLTNSVWSNLIITHNGTNTAIYLNGKLLNNPQNTYNTITQNKKYYFGIEVYPDGISPYLNDVNWSPFVGKIDDIRIYNRALTQEEISYLAGH